MTLSYIYILYLKVRIVQLELALLLSLNYLCNPEADISVKLMERFVASYFDVLVRVFCFDAPCLKYTSGQLQQLTAAL